MSRLAWLSPLVIGAVITSCGSVDTLDPAGAAGSSGGGQTGSAGAGGRGGGGGAAGKSCTDYQNDYIAAVAAAKACNAAIDSIQCQHIVSSQLLCGCPTAVNDRTEVDRIEAAWLAASCPVPVVCPAIACLAVARGQCTAINSGDRCVDVSATR